MDKNINHEDIDKIINDIEVFNNEDKLNEIGLKTKEVAELVLKINESIDKYCHSNEDNYMMELLANITKTAINKKYIVYDDLYTYNEEELIKKLGQINDEEIENNLYKFENITKEEVPYINLNNVKIRKLNPLVDGKRLI